MHRNPKGMNRRERKRFFEKSIDLAPVLIKKHDSLHFILQEHFNNPNGDEMELIRHNKHPNKELNIAYQDYKNILRELKTLEHTIKVFVEYDGSNKPIQRDNNKKPTGLHITK